MGSKQLVCGLRSGARLDLTDRLTPASAICMQRCRKRPGCKVCWCCSWPFDSSHLTHSSWRSNTLLPVRWDRRFINYGSLRYALAGFLAVTEATDQQIRLITVSSSCPGRTIGFVSLVGRGLESVTSRLKIFRPRPFSNLSILGTQTTGQPHH